MLAGCVSGRVRERMPQFLPLAPLPALAAAIWSPGAPPLVLPEPPFRMNLALDLPGALLLGTAAFLWIAAGLQAAAFAQNEPKRGRFAAWWLLTLAGNLGVFIAADLVSFYLTYSVVSLAAYGLITHDDNPGARRAGIVYVALAVLGEAFLLLGFVLMAAGPEGGLSIREAAAALPASPWRDAALALLVLGFGLKIGLVPGHVWMPLAYTAAPIPAAAALSGAAVKAGVIGFARFLPLGAAMPGWGYALAAAGIFSAFYGVLRRDHAAEPEDRAGLFERQPDGVAGGGVRHGAGDGRRRDRVCREFRRRSSRARQGRAVSGDWRQRRQGRAVLAGAAAGWRHRIGPRRVAADGRRAREARGQGAAGGWRHRARLRHCRRREVRC